MCHHSLHCLHDKYSWHHTISGHQYHQQVSLSNSKCETGGWIIKWQLIWKLTGHSLMSWVWHIVILWSLVPRPTFEWILSVRSSPSSSPRVGWEYDQHHLECISEGSESSRRHLLHNLQLYTSFSLISALHYTSLQVVRRVEWWGDMNSTGNSSNYSE